MWRPSNIRQPRRVRAAPQSIHTQTGPDTPAIDALLINFITIIVSKKIADTQKMLDVLSYIGIIPVEYRLRI